MYILHGPDQGLFTGHIDQARLYDHVLNLQGIKHPLTSPEGLDRGRKYIKSELEKIGVKVIEEEFEIEGFDGVFKNIVGVLDPGDGGSGEVIVSCHHDTVFNSPGANDNASACAAVLEIARVIHKNKDSLTGNYRFVFFDLEEGNPVVERRIWSLAKKYGIHQNGSFLKVQYRKNHELLLPYIDVKVAEGAKDRLAEKMSELAVSEDERNYYTELIDFFIQYLDGSNWVGKMALLGSSHYVSQAKLEKRKIRGIINLDTVGYTSDLKNSQIYPDGIPVKVLKLISKPVIRHIPLFSRSFKISGVQDVTAGNFASLITDENSKNEADIFLRNSKKVNLPVAGLYTNMNFDALNVKMSDLLRSDHSPFWREHIPGIFISDSANFRYPHYHTPSDLIYYVNFDFLEKITHVSLLTLIDMAERDGGRQQKQF